MDDSSYDHSKKAGNEGDVIKHAFLLDAVDRLLAEKQDRDGPVWYVDTHAARPYHRLRSSGRWTRGVGKLKKAATALSSSVLAKYLAFAFYEDDLITRKKTAFTHLGTRLYLGSSALAYQRVRLKAPERPLLMTLFDTDTDVALALFDYYDRQKAQPVMAFLDKHRVNEAGMAGLNALWNSLGGSRCLIVKGSSYEYLPQIAPTSAVQRPDLVFVDPHQLGDEREGVERLLDHSQRAGARFLCWTPLQAVPEKGFAADGWSFTHHGDEKEFVETCQGRGYRIAWFAWGSVTGGKQKCYGCQLTFDSSYPVAHLQQLSEEIRRSCQEVEMRTKKGTFRVKYWPE
jgi:hypothetical protein